MFPSIGATCLDNFKNHVEDFRAVIKEVYHDMSFDERTIANSRGYVEDDRLAKEAISELAYMLVNIHRDLNSHSENYIAGTTEKLDIFMTQTSPAPEEVVKQYEADSMYLASDRQFETCYEDTLKMLVADLERQDIWEPQSIYSQKVRIPGKHKTGRQNKQTRHLILFTIIDNHFVIKVEKLCNFLHISSKIA